MRIPSSHMNNGFHHEFNECDLLFMVFREYTIISPYGLLLSAHYFEW